MAGHRVTKKQIDLIHRMIEKEYRITSLRFFPHTGHITVGVRVTSGTRYFFIGRSGRLIEDADEG